MLSIYFGIAGEENDNIEQQMFQTLVDCLLISPQFRNCRTSVNAPQCNEVWLDFHEIRLCLKKL